MAKALFKKAGWLVLERAPLFFLCLFLLTIPLFSVAYYAIRFDFVHSNIASEVTYSELEAVLPEYITASVGSSAERAAQDINDQAEIALSLYMSHHCDGFDYDVPAPIDLIAHGFNKPVDYSQPPYNTFRWRQNAVPRQEIPSLEVQALEWLNAAGIATDLNVLCGSDIETILGTYANYDEVNERLVFGSSAIYFRVYDVNYTDGRVDFEIRYVGLDLQPKQASALSHLGATRSILVTLDTDAIWGLALAADSYSKMEISAQPRWGWTVGDTSPDFYHPEKLRWQDEVEDWSQTALWTGQTCEKTDGCTEYYLRNASLSAARLLGPYGLLQGAATDALTSLFFFENGRDAPINSSFARYLYFSTVTVTTLGYGDIVPITPRARMLVALHSFLGVLFAGLFLNAIGSRMTSQSTRD